jgi:3-methyl-2-oxobutanoate hydroxymethyltransferase
MRRKTIIDIANLKKAKTKIVCLTSYTAEITRIADQHVDLLLVGDSLGMVIYGMDSTLGVTVQMMINHAKAVVKSSQNALVVVDMPFASYQKKPSQAFVNAAKILTKSGAGAVKLEGGAYMAETIKFLTERGVPVMAHVGLTPQSVNQFGGYKHRGQDSASRKKIIADAVAVEKAGAFAVVVEGVKEELAAAITKKLKIPVIGIGASVKCDGQVLVTEDMLGLTSSRAKFVKQYTNLREDIDSAIGNYSKEVRNGDFPTDKYLYS